MGKVAPERVGNKAEEGGGEGMGFCRVVGERTYALGLHQTQVVVPRIY